VENDTFPVFEASPRRVNNYALLDIKIREKKYENGNTTISKEDEGQIRRQMDQSTLRLTEQICEIVTPKESLTISPKGNFGN
jgi:hypothetical protein